MESTTCCCDVVIVADGARARPGPGRTPDPRRAAITNALTGEPFTARQALALGIVDEVVAARDLSERARHGGRAVSVSGSAAAVGRPLFYQSREQTFEEALGEARRALARAFGTTERHQVRRDRRKGQPTNCKILAKSHVRTSAQARRLLGAQVARKDGKGAESNLRKPVDMSAVSVVPPKRLSDEVAEKIRSFIIQQGLADGTRLPSERSIAEQFGASRPTVSQALRTLSLMGLVEIRRGSGAYVLRQPDINITVSVNPMLELDRNSLSDLADLRLWLETLGVRQTADHVGADGLHLARAALERLRASVGATSAWIAADTIFHSTVVGMSGNPYLASIYESVHTAVISYEYRSWVENDTVPDWLRPDQAEAAVALHEPIVAALEAGDTEAAVLAVRNHHRAMLEHLMGRRSAQRESGG